MGGMNRVGCSVEWGPGSTPYISLPMMHDFLGRACRPRRVASQSFVTEAQPVHAEFEVFGSEPWRVRSHSHMDGAVALTA